MPLLVSLSAPVPCVSGSLPVAPPGSEVGQPGIGISLALLEAVRHGVKVPFVVSKFCACGETCEPLKSSAKSTVPIPAAEAGLAEPSKPDTKPTATPLMMPALTRRREERTRIARCLRLSRAAAAPKEGARSSLKSPSLICVYVSPRHRAAPSQSLVVCSQM